MKSINIGLALLISATSVFAANIYDLDVGDGMYMQGILSDELVYVVRIDTANNRVKVRRSEDGTTKWVNPSQLISRETSTGNDVERALIGVGVVACLLNPDACKSTSTSSSKNNYSRNTWVPGAQHNLHSNVVASNEKNIWQPADGYQWVDKDNSWEVFWKSGLPHSRYKNVVSSDTEGNWVPKSGYDWKDKNNSWEVRWSAGKKHPDIKKVVSCEAIDKWCPDKGYTWVEFQKSWEVKWTKGISYSGDAPNVVSAEDEGYWVPAPGYRWIDRNKFTVEWQSGVVHPTSKKLISTRTEHIWKYIGGIGVILQIKDSLPVIVKVHPGSPAQKSGIKEGLFLAEIDGKSTKSRDLEDVVSMLSGNVNTDVSVTFFDKLTEKYFSYRLTRGIYTLKI